MTRYRRGVIALLTALLTAAWCGYTTQPAAAATALNGTFTLTPGSCSGGSVSGTYLRMILPSGSFTGPYMSNADSHCSDQTFTPLSGGTDGGLISGSYQPTPDPPFDATGNALAGRITAPSPFYGTSFATSSNPKDPQTGRKVSAPQVYATGSSLSADLRAFSVTWNNQYFNQGAPKPDGSLPGNTRRATGTYNSGSGAFTLSWTSQVVGGPFDKFTGQWHLAGRFVPSGGSAGSSSTATPAGGAAVPATTVPAATARAPAVGHSSGAARASGTATAAAHAVVNPQLASTTTTATEHWRVQWWVIVIAAALAVLGFGAIAALNNAVRKSRVPS